MRAEVGLLTRNVLIHGAMGEKCLDVDSAACQAVGFDNFGGHTKALRGFKAYNIEGAELTNMGQMSVLGSYPIHFHMCHNTTENGQEHPLIQSNSIHHCFRYESVNKCLAKLQVQLFSSFSADVWQSMDLMEFMSKTMLLTTHMVIAISLKMVEKRKQCLKAISGWPLATDSWHLATPR